MTARLAQWLGAPVRAAIAIARGIVSLSRQQVRSLFSVAMLGGVIALSTENWILMALAHHSVEDGEVLQAWLGLLIERTRYNSGLQAWFAGIMGLIVFGADWFRARWGDNEISAGAGADNPARDSAP